MLKEVVGTRGKMHGRTAKGIGKDTSLGLTVGCYINRSIITELKLNSGNDWSYK